jgi:hypothetical protein
MLAGVTVGALAHPESAYPSVTVYVPTGGVTL